LQQQVHSTINFLLDRLGLVCPHLHEFECDCIRISIEFQLAVQFFPLAYGTSAFLSIDDFDELQAGVIQIGIKLSLIKIPNVDYSTSFIFSPYFLHIIILNPDIFADLAEKPMLL
jgi:hypothetical protein